MPAPHLPQELIDHIISCIGDYIVGYHDPRLRAAALVCRAWVEPARRVMLRTVHLRSLRLSICAALLGLLDRTPAVAEYIKEIFWDLRDSYHTDDLVVHPLLDRISTITVKHGISQRVWIDLKWNGGGTFAAVLDRAPAIGPFVRDVQWFFDDGRQELWTDSEIVGLELARRLRRMRKLALTQTGYFPFEATAPFSRLPNAMASTSVTHLCLNCVVFSSTAEYASFISSFTRLKDLHIDHVEIKDQELADFSGSVSPPLRSVVLGPTESKLALFSYLINAPTSRPRVLTTLHAVIGLDVSGVVVNRLLQAYDATLRTLSLRDLTGAAIDLSSCRALIDLRLQDQSLHIITTALGLVQSENLRSLRIEVHTGKDEDWQKLGVVLTGVHFAHLDILRICYWSKDRHTPLPQVLLQPLQRKALIWKENFRPTRFAR